jgi:hypothetical protein
MSHRSETPISEGSAFGEELLHFNGIDGRCGTPAVEPVTRGELAARIRRLTPQAFRLGELRSAVRDAREQQLETRDGFEELDLAQAGWGLILPEHGDPEVERQLGPLIEHRRRQAGRISGRRFQVYRGARGYQHGLGSSDFRELRGGALGAVDPDRMPYYLLLAGGPEEIPFHFQFGLDVRHAVGRVCFDTPEEYHRYATSVVEYERSKENTLQRDLALFASRPIGDRVAEALADDLVGGLGSALDGRPVGRWRVTSTVGKDATRQRLAQLVGGAGRADLLFVACHGASYEPGESELRARQGAVLCQPAGGAHHFFSGDDLARRPRSSFRGLISVLFGCYSGGTPAPEDGPELIGRQPPRRFAPPFVARLPQRLLAHPGGGALAVIAQVGLACGFSFCGHHNTLQLNNFEDLLRRLMHGETVGRAAELMNLQAADLSIELWRRLDAEVLQAHENPDRLIRLYIAMEDARRYLVLGDPAVRFNPMETG